MELENKISQSEFGLDYHQLGFNEKEWVDDEININNFFNF